MVAAAHFAILTHNRPRSLALLLASVSGQEFDGSTKLTIFDNGSRPEAAARVRDIALRYGAAVVRSQVNLRMAGRRALEDHLFDSGLDADVLVHLDDDVVLSPGWLGAALAGLAGDRVAACGSIEDREGDFMVSGQRAIDVFECPTRFGLASVWRWSWQVPNHEVGCEPVEFAGHRALAVKTEVAQKVRHDPELVAGGDDIGYSLALRHVGFELRVATGALISHRSLGEPDVPGFHTHEGVTSSWMRFYQRWGFVRDTAAAEVGMSLPDFLNLVTRPRRSEGFTSSEGQQR